MSAGEICYHNKRREIYLFGLNSYILSLLMSGSTPFFNIKSSKRSNPEARTTLDTLHTMQIHKMNENENLVSELENEKKNIEKMLENVSVSNPAELDELEDKIKKLNGEIHQRKDKNEFLNYFLETGDILYNYYDMQQKIQNGDILTKQTNKRKPGSILDVLEKADETPVAIVPKQKNKQTFISRDKLLEEYLKKVHPENVRVTNNVLDDTFGECDICEKEMVFSANEAVFTCTECGRQEFVLIDSDKPSYKDPPREVSYYTYKRINHFNEWLAQFQAKESTEIPQEVFDAIMVELKKERILDTRTLKRTKIREILKKLKLNKFYEHVPHIINRLNGLNAPIMSREVEEKLRYMFREIQPSFQKHCPEGRNNFLSYSYVLYKFCELLELDEYLSCFPLLKNRDKLYVQDKIWELICKELKWQYVRSI